MAGGLVVAGAGLGGGGGGGAVGAGEGGGDLGGEGADAGGVFLLFGEGLGLAVFGRVRLLSGLLAGEAVIG